MSDFNEISIYISVKTAEDITFEHPPPRSNEGQLHCDMWTDCANAAYCQHHGCIDVHRIWDIKDEKITIPRH